MKQEVNKKINSIKLPESKILKTMLNKKVEFLNNKILHQLKNTLKNSSELIIITQVSKMKNLDCKCRKEWNERLQKLIKFRIMSVEKMQIKLTDFIQAKYMDIVEKLILDIRIFLFTNLTIFLIILLISLFKKKAVNHLFLPSILIVISTTVSSYFYLFNQNWLYTIIYNDYTGFGYMAYIFIIFAILSDIIFNKARVTTEIINLIANIIGSTFSVSTC